MFTRAWTPLVCRENPSLLNYPMYRIHKYSGVIRHIHGTRSLKPHYRERDCARLSVSAYGHKRNLLLHRAYLLVFHGPPPVDDRGRFYTGDHINGNHLDARPANYQWLSIRDQNAKRSRRQRPSVTYTVFEPKPGEVVRRFQKGWAVTSEGRILRNGKVRASSISSRRDGYVTVTIEKIRYFLHRLVAHLFLDYDLHDTEHVIMHLNHIKTDCRAVNLRIGTPSENMLHTEHSRHPVTECNELQ